MYSKRRPSYNVAIQMPEFGQLLFADVNGNALNLYGEEGF